MGRKKSSHGIDILQTIPWDTMKKDFRPMGCDIQKKIRPMGWDDFQKFPSHPIPWDGMGWDRPIPRGALVVIFIGHC
jgi:hypothetical protein